MHNDERVEMFPQRAIKVSPWVSISAALLLAATSTAAMAAEEPKYEITPFAGVATGGDFESTLDGTKRKLKDDGNWGVAFNFAEQPHAYYEIFYSKQGTSINGTTPVDLDVQYLQVGGTLLWAEGEHVIPYIVATVGAARLDPDAPGLDATTRLAFTLGGGLRIPIVKHVALRLEARGYASVLNSSGDIFCDSSASDCSIRARSRTLLQYSATAGVAIGF